MQCLEGFRQFSPTPNLKIRCCGQWRTQKGSGGPDFHFFKNMILEICPKTLENVSRRAFPSICESLKGARNALLVCHRLQRKLDLGFEKDETSFNFVVTINNTSEEFTENSCNNSSESISNGKKSYRKPKLGKLNSAVQFFRIEWRF